MTDVSDLELPRVSPLNREEVHVRQDRSGRGDALRHLLMHDRRSHCGDRVTKRDNHRPNHGRDVSRDSFASSYSLQSTRRTPRTSQICTCSRRWAEVCQGLDDKEPCGAAGRGYLRLAR